MSSEFSIRVENVSKRYRLGGKTDLLSERLGRGRPRAAPEDFWALRDVSCEIAPGDVVGLVGRNGAGKSTLLKILSRITPPTEGRVRLRGRVGTLLEVGTGFHPELTGRENVFLSGTILGMSRHEVERQFEPIVEFSGIERFLDTPVKRYSSGMYVRLAFAVAAHLEPEILLVDEVLAVGDAEFQRKCLGKMEDVAQEGRTVVFVSHNLSTIQRLCTRALWIDAGTIAAEGQTREVVGAYLRKAGASQHGGIAEVAEDVARISTGDTARLRRVALLDGDDQPVSALTLGQPFTVALTYDVTERIDDGVIELGFSTGDGVRVVTVQNIDGDRPVLALEPGRHEIRVAIDATFLPGEFAVDVALHRLVGLTLDQVERTLTFTALNTALDSEDRWPWDRVKGSVRVGADWSVRAPVAS